VWPLVVFIQSFGYTGRAEKALASCDRVGRSFVRSRLPALRAMRRVAGFISQLQGSVSPGLSVSFRCLLFAVLIYIEAGIPRVFRISQPLADFARRTAGFLQLSSIPAALAR